MSRATSEDDLWCRRYRPCPEAATRLVCLPHAGGSAPFFRPVAMALGAEADVLAVQYPGRQERRSEPPVDDMTELADRVHGVLSRQPELPTTLLGHSMGALLAFEVARRMEADGRRPVHLFLSGRRAPSTPRGERIHLRDDEGILSEIRSMDGTATAVLGDEELMRAALPALRADYRATEDHECPPDTMVAAPITAITGDADPKTSVDDARAWMRHTTAAFELLVYTGGHFFLTGHVAEINEVLSRHLAGSVPVAGGSVRRAWSG